ncbi:MAG: YihA family ribosome biogenesis GTP-binding protein [Ruminococcaceae bacterium]|nr:YihA family ribosome biogenesis GTP-binding protein [Oscillospiraceae bacterium]
MPLNLNRVSLRISAGLPRQFPTDPMVQIAFSGRSNVGKSSLINSLLGRKSLARVSSEPGKTITINFYDVDKKLFLVDLPGYGFAKRRPEDKAQWSALTDGYFTKNPNLDLLRLVVQLIDSRVGPTADDEMMLQFLRQSQIPFVIVATKSDKLNATERRRSEELLRNHPEIPTDTPILFYSSMKNTGRDELWKLLSEASGIKL